MVTSFVDEHGEEPSYTYPSARVDSMMDGNEMIVLVKKSFVEQAEELYITIENFTYSEKKMEENQLEIEIPDEYTAD